MQFPHLFEWMDLDWLPTSLRNTMREILECGNAQPFRPYYSWVTTEVKRQIIDEGYQNVVELGAGTAPITRLLARDPDLQGVRLIVCDLKPDIEGFRDLEARFPGRVSPVYEPVDFSKPRVWPPKTLLFLSGTFHHVPPAVRKEVLWSLSKSADRIMMFEPLRKTLFSVLFVFLSILPALILPLWFINRPGRLRRVSWCWPPAWPGKQRHSTTHFLLSVDHLASPIWHVILMVVEKERTDSGRTAHKERMQAITDLHPDLLYWLTH
jgi:hypothetical protein